MTSLERMLNDAQSVADFARRYAAHLTALLSALDPRALEGFAAALRTARREGRTVFIAGNGGSASSASHWATDLAQGTGTAQAPPVRAISLTDNVAVMSALANDRGYADVFVGQLEHLFCPGDLLIVISASGNSENVVRAVEYANACDGITLGVLGFDGGRLKDLCRVAIVVATEPREYGPVEDVHLILNHLLVSWLRRDCDKEAS